MHQAQTPRIGPASTFDRGRRALADVDVTERRPLLTRAEYELVRTERDQLRARRDRELTELLREVRTLVTSDAAEEIAQIQDDWTAVDARIVHLDLLVREARIVADDALASDLVGPGRSVTVRYPRTGRVATYRITGAGATDNTTVTARSPIGQALLGHSTGDHVSAQLPYRSEDLEILAVHAIDAASAGRARPSHQREDPDVHSILAD